MSKTKNNTLRREKSTVLKQLPRISFHTQYVKLSHKQLTNYLSTENKTRNEALSLHYNSKSNKSPIHTHIFSLISQLKQLCIFDQESSQSAKMEWLAEYISEMHPANVPHTNCDKALIFTQYSNLFHGTWNLATRYLADFHPLRYDSSLSDKERLLFTKRFQKDEKHRLAIMGIKSGGVGLTLTRANRIIFLDQWWNPAIMKQAAARIHRIGQKKTCTVINLITSDSIEERILSILERKELLFEKVMNHITSGASLDNKFENLSNALTHTSRDIWAFF